VAGGLLVDTADWRWVFYANLPSGLAAFVFALLTLPRYEGGGAGRFDLAGFVLAGAGFAALMYALTEDATLGWRRPEILGAALGVAVSATGLTLPADVDHRRVFGVTALFSPSGALLALRVPHEDAAESRGAGRKRGNTAPAAA
jgi:MFS family permease